MSGGTIQWLSLFDTFEAEHVCELIAEDFKAQSMDGFTPRLHVSLRSILVKNLNEYLEDQSPPKNGRRIDIVAALTLLELTVSLANRIERKKCRQKDALALRQLWMEFIAMGSAHRMYHDLPIEKVKADKRRRTAVKNASAPRTAGKLPSAEKLRAALAKVASIKGKRSAVSIVARRYGTTSAAVRKKSNKSVT